MEHFSSRIPAIINLFAPCVAFTFGQRSWFRLPRELVSGRVRRHEAEHRRQFRVLGTRRVIEIYSVQLFTVGYRNIDLEIMARLAEGEGLD